MNINADKIIRELLQGHLFALGGLQNVWQNKEPAAGFDVTKAHQKSFMMRAGNKTVTLSGKNTLHSGIFQVSLCYPTGIGTNDIEARAVLVQNHFAAGTVLEADGVKVRIKGRPSIGDPISQSPYVVPVSIGYESFN